MGRKYAPWALNHAHVDLIQPDHFNDLPDGTELFSINGERKIKGKDEIDQDTRFGFIAWGFLCFDQHPGQGGLGMFVKEE